MKIWIGKAIALIGIIHTVFVFFVFRKVIGEIIAEGFFNTVQEQENRNYAFWFIFFGFVAVILGLLVNYLERLNIALPRFLGWSLLALTLLLVAIMPISGGWLLFIPACGAIYRQFQVNTDFKNQTTI